MSAASPWAPGAVRVLVAQLDPAAPAGPLADWLRAAGATLRTWRAHNGTAAPGEAHDAVVVLGGRAGVYDEAEHPWLAAVRGLLSEALAAGTPVLAIDLGALALALAAGGEVAEDTAGGELGAQLIAKRSAAAADPLLREAPITPDVVQWHYDAITRLPPGAVLLASSPRYAAQAFRVGLAWGFQFHIEATAAAVREWARLDAESLVGFDVAALLERCDAVWADIAETWAPVAEAFMQVARDPVAASADAAPTAGAEPLGHT
ncbi:MAG: type 1 glutamine amidotransferase, partial [Frankiaceae bacterium]|nr:type 1 glutamine amidotransferase [Frankiaceae bacterium]